MKLNIRNTYHQTLQLLKFQKKLVLPFFIFAAIEAIVVTLIYLSPRGIVRPVLAPVIKAFKGEMYLHYPANFLILPQLHSICRNFLSVILGSLLTGTAVVMINEAYQKRSALFMQSVKVAATKYLQLFTIILFIAIILNYSYKGLSFGIAHYFSGARRLLLGAPYSVWIGPITVILSVLILLVVQAFFAYALIILMLDKKGLFKSIWLSFVFCSKHLWQTLAIVTLPFLCYAPIMILEYKTAYLIENLFPELVLIIAYAGVIISSLIVDLLVTVSSVLFYINNKE